MEKHVLLWAGLLVTLLACAFSQANISPPTVQLPDTPTPHLTATALAAQTQTIATLAAKSEFQWDIKVIQDNNFVSVQNNEFRLQRKPFTLYIEISKPIAVFMNVLDNDSNFTKIHAGLYADDDCTHGMHTFCSYYLMVIATEPGDLVIDEEFGDGLHGFDLDPRLGELGSQFVITDHSIIYGRYVSRLVMIGTSPGEGTPPPKTVIPIEQFTGRLYLKFLAKYQPGNVINDDELRKLVLVFQWMSADC